MRIQGERHHGPVPLFEYLSGGMTGLLVFGATSHMASPSTLRSCRSESLSGIVFK